MEPCHAGDEVGVVLALRVFEMALTGHGEVAGALPALRLPGFGIAGEVSDKCDFVHLEFSPSGFGGGSC